MINLKAIAIMAAVVVMPLTALSQSVSFLTVSPDAESQAMAGASVASDANAFAIYNNPAAIGLSEDTFAAAVSYGTWNVLDSSSKMTSFATYYKLSEKFGFAASYRSFDNPSYEIYDDTGNYKGDYTPNDSAFDLAASLAISSNFAVGATFKTISSKLSDSYSGSGVSFDLGVTYKLDALTIGASFSNLGSIEYGDNSYSLPTIAKFGGSYQMLVNDFNVTANAQAEYLTEEGALGVALGAQTFYDMYFVRAGYYVSGDDTIMPSYLSVGAGVEYSKIAFNVSYLISETVGGSMNLGLGYRF